MKIDLSEVLSICAIFISIFSISWQIKNSRAKVKVNLIFGDAVGELGVYIFVRNISNYEVHINSVSLLYPHEKLTFFKNFKHIIKYRRFHKYEGWVNNLSVFEGLDTKLPISIQPRKSHEIFIPKENINRIFSANCPPLIVASCQDALWNNEHSNIFDVSDLLEKSTSPQ